MAARLVIITCLASIGFFNFHNLISLPVQRLGFMLMLVVCAAYSWSRREVRLRDISFPRLPWFVFMCGLVVSMFMASFYHQQSITASIIAQSTGIFAYMSFFVLLMLNPDPDKLMRYVVVVVAISFVVFAANLVTFPNNIFGEPILSDLSRGMVRVRQPLILLTSLLLFYSINKWQVMRSWRWLAIAGGCVLLVVLSLTRQVMALTALLCFFQILHNMSWGKKLLLGSVLLVTGYVVMINMPMYKDLKELSEEQIDATESGQKEDVRIGAWRYYAYEANEDTETFLFGNGTPSAGKSVWGKRFEAYADETGYLVGDVAWPAVVFQYGLISAVALLTIAFCAIFKHKSRDKQYLTYFMIYAVLSGIASGVWYYYHEIFIIMIALYLLYRKSDDKKMSVPVQEFTEVKKLRKFVTE